MKKCKRSFSMFLALMLLLAIIPMTASAAKPIPGDANGDGKVNYLDALKLARMSIGLEPMDNSLMAYCDTNKDGKLNYLDSLTVLQVSIGIVEMPPMGPVTETFEGEFTYSESLELLSDNWNPHTYTTSEQGYPLDYLTAGLYRFFYNDEENYVAGKDPFEGYVIAPEMAAELPVDVTIEVSATRPEFDIPWNATEGYAYKIALNPDACWQDGTPITADDYVESMKRLLDPKLQNYRAEDFATGSLPIAGAGNYLRQGLYRLQDNGKTMEYLFLDELVTDASGFYYTPNDEEVYIAVGYPIDYLGGYSLKDYVDAYGSDYFDMEYWNELVSLCDEEGKVRCNRSTLEMLLDVTTGNPAWGEDESYLYNYLLYGKTYPEFDFENVGLYKSGEYEITMVLTKSVTGFDLLYALTTNWLVKLDLYDACLFEDGTTTYCTSLETTASYGPYKLESYEPGDSMVFVKNEKWYGYDDGKHVYVDPTDGKTYPMYQTTRIECTQSSDYDMQFLKFLCGEQMMYGLNTEGSNYYRDSELCYFNPGSNAYSLIFNGHSEAITRRENASGFDQSKYDLEVLTVNAFRKALSLSYDKKAFNANEASISFPAYGLLGDSYIYDVDTGASYRSTDAAKKALCEVYSVDLSKFATLDEAVASITGFDAMTAKIYYRQAFQEALAKGYVTDNNNDGICDQTIRITYACSNSPTLNAINRLEYLTQKANEAAAGTPFAGKIEFTASDPLGNEWSNELKAGNMDVVLGGWSGSDLNPFGLIDVYTNPNYQYDAAWCDYSTLDLTLNLGGKDITLNLREWTLALNGNEIVKNGVSYNFGDGMADPMDRVTILAGIEKSVLLTYNYIPMSSSGSAFLLSPKIFFANPNYNEIMGRGGIAYIRYNYNDEEWIDYMESINGELDI